MALDSADIAPPVGHDRQLEGLFGNLAAGRLAHGLLFTGPEGIGKFIAARWFAAGLLCERGPSVDPDAVAPCLMCGACRRVRAGSHPDLFVVDAEAEGFDKLSIFFIAHRDLRPKEAYQGPAVEDFLDLRSAEGRGKVVLVRQAETMLEEAQNAFLKTLEEPRPGVYLVLETSAQAALLPTVLSRLVRVEFGPLADRDVARVLAGSAEAAGLDPEERAALVRMARGAPGRALRLARRNVLGMRELLDRALAGEQDVSAVARALWQLDGDFSARTESAERRLRAETFLDLGLEVLRDLERRRAGYPAGELVHGDAPLPRRDGEHERRQRMDAWVAARQDLLVNLGPEALVDRALSTL